LVFVVILKSKARKNHVALELPEDSSSRLGGTQNDNDEFPDGHYLVILYAEVQQYVLN
jgi:hypothetical protein